MWAVMADYGIPAGDKQATIVGIHSPRCVGKTTGMQTHPVPGCAINVTLCWWGKYLERREMLGRRRVGTDRTIRLMGTVNSELRRLR